MTLFEELNRRGLTAQMTHEDKIKDALDNTQVTFYIGFDATADSLHVGHFLQLMVMKRMQEAGHRPIALLGTGTTMIGDPTGKTDMRKMLTIEEINYNADRFRDQMSKFLDFSDGKAIMVKNGDWLFDLNYIPFLRDVGRHFSVNKMLSAECFKSRLEKGLSFIEFNYMIMQSYDFLRLRNDYNCTMQLGGDDQWSNIIGGIELIRKAESKEAQGMTFTLLTTKEGKKMGKTENGALWLDPEKTSEFDFFQYWRNVADSDVINCLKLLTFVPIEEIEEMERTLEGSQLNIAKEKLAFEITKMVHSEEQANKALEAAKALFSDNTDSDDMPTTVLSGDDLVDGGAGILDLMTMTGICGSKSDARRLVVQGGVSVDGVKIEDPKTIIKVANENGYVVVKKGKKVFHKISV